MAQETGAVDVAILKNALSFQPDTLTLYEQLNSAIPETELPAKHSAHSQLIALNPYAACSPFLSTKPP